MALSDILALSGPWSVVPDSGDVLVSSCVNLKVTGQYSGHRSCRNIDQCSRQMPLLSGCLETVQMVLRGKKDTRVSLYEFVLHFRDLLNNTRSRNSFQLPFALKWQELKDKFRDAGKFHFLCLIFSVRR